MKLESITTTYFVEHAGCHYRTTDGNNWEVAMGESWEPEYHAEHELRNMFALLKLATSFSEFGRIAKRGETWSEVMKELASLYHAWAKNDWSTEQVDGLMKACDEWLG